MGLPHAERDAKDVHLLVNTERLTRLLGGTRFTSCKSAKDRKIATINTCICFTVLNNDNLIWSSCSFLWF